jgi:ribose transport system permease protein
MTEVVQGNVQARQPDPSPLASSAPRGPGSRLRGAANTARLANAERYGLLLIWAIIVIVFSVVEPGTYPTMGNVSTIFGSQAPLMVVTLGLLIPLTAGDFDLSIASVLSLSAMTVALTNVNDGWNIGFSVLAGLATGVIVGLVNGLLVTTIDLDPFIVTLGMATLIEGIVFGISQSNTISGLSTSLVNWTNTNFLGIPREFWYALGGVVVLWLAFQFTTWGRRLLFVGRNRNVARLSGINVRRMRTGAFVLSGMIAAIAGILYAGTTGSADPSSGQTFLLPAFAAAFLGMTTIQPGRFNPWGAFVAVYTLISGITGLELLGLSTWVQDVFYGAALVVAIAAARLMARRRAETA